jgi:hypothetical protein
MLIDPIWHLTSMLGVKGIESIESRVCTRFLWSFLAANTHQEGVLRDDLQYFHTPPRSSFSCIGEKAVEVTWFEGSMLGAFRLAW